MSKSNLVSLELSGILRKLYALNILDEHYGIISIPTQFISRENSEGLLVYKNGAYTDQFGLDIIRDVFKNTDIHILSATRENGVAYFEAVVSSVFDDLRFTIQYPREEY